MASTSARRRPAAQTFLPDEIWEEIFLLLDAAADLARASAACSSFRRIVSKRRFLRRFRSLRSPAILGLIGCSRYQPFLPVGPPHRSAPEARALEQAADFTFSFLPDGSRWSFRHARDGRVLLSRISFNLKNQFEDFLICDPLHRRYVKIPRIPDDLMSSAADSSFSFMTQHALPVLAPAGENDGEESFRVICTVHDKGKGKVVVFVFSSCNQTWRAVDSTISLSNEFIECQPFYAHGCLYWMFCRMACSLMLDISETKFSIIDLPPHNVWSMRAIVEAADGRLGFLTVGDGTIDMYCKNWQSNGVCAQDWLLNKLIPLPEFWINWFWETDGIAGRYIALSAHHGIVAHHGIEIREVSPIIFEHFVLDIKTLLLEKLCISNKDKLSYFPYARFPPPLALPSI